MKYKRIIAMALVIMTILSIAPLDTFAGLSPYDPDLYGKGTYSDPVDYKKIYQAKFYNNEARVPTAKFSVINKSNGSIIGTSADDDTTITRVEDIPVGTTISIDNLSTKGSGTAIDMVDFQVTKDGSQVDAIQDKPTVLNSYALTLDNPGTYKFYLCVRDNTDKSKTDGWGNWSYNGPHQAKGLNYGINATKETVGTPETAGGDDFWGYWYFTEIVIVAIKNPPIPDFTINYKNNDVTDNKTSPVTLDASDKSLVLEDYSKPFSSAEPITERKWYYWDVTSGWKEISGSINKTTVTINDMDANLPGSGLNKAFKLECTSNTGASANASHTAYFKVAPPPPTPGTADIYVYYRDKDTGADVSTADTVTYKGVAYGTYLIPARDIPNYTLDTAMTPSPQTVTVDAVNNFKEVVFYYISQGEGSGNEPPVAIINGPGEEKAGANCKFDGRKSYDKDGTIEQYIWDFPGAALAQNSNGYIIVWYPYEGNYTRTETVKLTVVDDQGASDTTECDIDILPPTPTAALTVDGIYKENRKVTLDTSGSTSPSRYPINSYIWTITNPANVKSVAPLNGNAKNDVIYKAAGTYNNTISITNTVGLSDSETKSVTIVPDQNPNANFAVTTKLLRNPSDSNQAIITLTNLSSSPDGDPIKKTVMFYAYDSDNDGNFDEEVWKYSTNGTTWNNVGLAYSQIKTNFGIYNISGGNPMTFTLKTNQVGKYKFEAMAIEDIPAADTIPSLLSPSDCRRGDTFTTKLDSQKIVDVINTAPTVTFDVKKKKEVDVLIATDYTGQKLSDLQAALNVQKANLLAKNIDVKYTIVNSTAAMAHINDAQYWYRRYGRYNFIADKDTWSSSGNGHSYNDESYQELLLWEEKTALESEAPYLPLRSPGGLRWSKSSEVREEEPGDDTPDWERWHYYVNMSVSNDGYKDSGVLDFTTRRYNGLQSDSGSTYGYEYSNIHSESVSVDSSWQKEEKIADVTVDVNSINFASITSAPLRANSDRYLLFVGDSSSRLYSGSWGSHFPFGGLTKTEQDYIKNNNIKPYIITPSTSLDAIVGAEKALSTIPTIGYTYFKGIDGTMKLLYNDGYPISIDLGADIKAVYGDYVLLSNSTLKYRVSAATFKTLASNVTKVMQEKDGFDGSIGDIRNLWVITSDGKLRQYVSGVQKNVLSYSDAVDIYNGDGIAYGTGCYIISCTSGTYFINKYGPTKQLYSAPVSGFKYMDARDVRDGDFADYVVVLIYKNGCVQLWREWIDSKTDYETGTTTHYIRELNPLALYKGIYNEAKEKEYYYAFPWVTPITGMSCIISGNLFQIDGISYIYDSAEHEEYYYIDMTNPKYSATGVRNVVKNVRYFNNGTIGVPCIYNQKNIGYKGSVSYRWVTYYADVPVLHGKTIIKVISGNGATAVFTSDGLMYKWTDTVPYLNPAVPACTFTLTSDNVGGAYSNSYYIIKNWDPTMTTYNYYWDKSDDTLKKMDDDSVVFNNVVDVQISSDNHNLYIVTKDGKLYGQGYFGRTHKSGIIYYPIGDPFHELVKTKIVINDTTKQYITLRDVITAIPTSKYFGAGQYAAALNDITNTYLNDSSFITNYILVGDGVSYKIVYNDYENDAKFQDNWTYNHDPYYFENSMGFASFNGQTLTSPITRFDRKGKYTINVKARDNPKSDNRFDNYRLWSTGNQNVILYVHEKPIALQRLTVTNNGNGTYTVKAFDSGSYDNDHTSRMDKGISAQEWRWKESTETTWHSGQMNKADCNPDKTYITQLRVKDLEGAYSDYNTIEIDANNPPVALFSVDKNPITITELLKVKDLSFPQSFSTLTKWHWIVKKFNDDGTLPSGTVQNGTYNTNNAGTGSMAGYDTNVKTDYTNAGTGKYRIYLRVEDSNGLWSDGGSDSTYDLNKFYCQDITVQESFKLSGFKVVKIRDLKLEPYYNVSGRYPDKPMGVNSMAIDPSNFIVGGISTVPGFESLTKGYRFEFEIDSTNFNEVADTIVITPRFFTYTDGVPGIRGPQVGLYWEDSNKNICKAGEGGHSRWADITLDNSSKTITGANTATWRGEYFIPATSWAVPSGTSAANAKANKINADLIVNFTIKGYKSGVMKYDYNLQQWPIERTVNKAPYQIGDVIRYDYTKSSLDDKNVIINRP